MLVCGDRVDDRIPVSSPPQWFLEFECRVTWFIVINIIYIIFKNISHNIIINT